MSANPRSYVETLFATVLQVDQASLFGQDMTLAQIVEASPKLVNSVDFMECCAAVAAALKKETGRKVQLPVTTLDTPISAIVEDFLRQTAE